MQDHGRLAGKDPCHLPMNEMPVTEVEQAAVERFGDDIGLQAAMLTQRPPPSAAQIRHKGVNRSDAAVRRHKGDSLR